MFGAPGRVANALVLEEADPPDPETFTITKVASSVYIGYSDGTGAPPAHGSIDVGVIYNGLELRTVSQVGLGPNISIFIEGNHAQTFLDTVEMVGYETLDQGDVIGFTYDGGDDQTEWAFAISSSHWSAGGTDDVILTYVE